MLAMAAVDGDGHMLAGAGACRLGSQLLRLRFFVSSHAGVEQSRACRGSHPRFGCGVCLRHKDHRTKGGGRRHRRGDHRIDVEAEDEAIAGRAAAQLAADLRELPGRA